MIWRTDEAAEIGDCSLIREILDACGRVGHIQELTVDASGVTIIPISASPVYVLARTDYEAADQALRLNTVDVTIWLPE